MSKEEEKEEPSVEREEKKVEQTEQNSANSKNTENSDNETGNVSAEGDKKGRRIIFILIPIIILVIAGTLYFFLFHFNKNPSAKKNPENAPVQTKAGAVNTSTYIFIDFDDIAGTLMIVNNQRVYIKISFTLQLASEGDVNLVNQNRAFILDSIQSLFHEIRPNDLSGPAGILMLRTELMRRINKIIAPSEVKDILFKQIYMS